MVFHENPDGTSYVQFYDHELEPRNLDANKIKKIPKLGWGPEYSKGALRKEIGFGEGWPMMWRESSIENGNVNVV